MSHFIHLNVIGECFSLLRVNYNLFYLAVWLFHRNHFSRKWWIKFKDSALLCVSHKCLPFYFIYLYASHSIPFYGMFISNVVQFIQTGYKKYMLTLQNSEVLSHRTIYVRSWKQKQKLHFHCAQNYGKKQTNKLISVITYNLFSLIKPEFIGVFLYWKTLFFCLLEILSEYIQELLSLFSLKLNKFLQRFKYFAADFVDEVSSNGIFKFFFQLFQKFKVFNDLYFLIIMFSKNLIAPL